MLTGARRPLVDQVFAISAVAFLYAHWADQWLAQLISKPVPVLLLAGVVAGVGLSHRRRLLVFVGLLLSALGDILLAWSEGAFIFGLVSFLLAHVAYIVAFSRVTRTAALGWLVPFALWGGGVYAVLWPGLGDLAVPVAVYVSVIVTMVWRAAATWGVVAGGGLAFLGAALFVLSDSMLALNRFHEPFLGAREGVILTYWAAQVFIARSVLPR